MKYFLFIAFFGLIACGNKKNYPVAADSLDAAREFLTGCLKGDFEKASFYMVQDEQNKKLLQEASETYLAKSAAQQTQYAQSSLQNVTIENISTTETIINYKNSYDNVARKVKVVLVNQQWLIDFKYTFNGNL